MKRQGGGFGVVMLLVVVAIVLLLVARSWKSSAPTAIEVATPGGTVAVPDHGQSEAAAEASSGVLPNIHDMQRETGAHADEVQNALQEID
jgi:hypothetical protein